MPSRSRHRRFRGVSAIALALVAVLALAGSADAARVFKKGSHGKRVVSIQRALGLHADGVFGPATKRAVKRFQRRNHLTADGIVGPATWALIRQRRLGQRAPRSHARGGGNLVMRLQRALHISADGVFGPDTAHAVKAFQRAHGLTADGIVGPATWAALGHPGTTRILKRRHSHRSTGGLPIRVRRVIAAASRIATKPYKYGGGHRQWFDSGYDCSGSVSFALHGAGLLSSPLDSSSLMSYGAAGRGRWITIYANPGHAYMVVAGRRFDTTGRDESGSRWNSQMRSSSGYVARHPVGL